LRARKGNDGEGVIGIGIKETLGLIRVVGGGGEERGGGMTAVGGRFGEEGGEVGGEEES
jgi:hypothetical protein